MSMLSTQVENLRIMARLVRDYDYVEVSRMLREAADTIESLSAKLASCWDTCHVASSRWDETMEEQCVELSCGHSVWGRDAEPPNYCPDCGKKVEQ